MYDEHDRLVRSITTVEPEWTEREQAVMLALQEYRDGLCPSCGRPLAECTAAESEEQYAVQVRRCHATTAKHQEAELYRESPHPEALLFSVRRR